MYFNNLHVEIFIVMCDHLTSLDLTFTSIEYFLLDTYYFTAFNALNGLLAGLLSLVLSIGGVLCVKTNIANSLVFALKFLVLIAVFIFIRGGIPRYRYDFLTKIG